MNTEEFSYVSYFRYVWHLNDREDVLSKLVDLRKYEQGSLRKSSTEGIPSIVPGPSC